MHLIRTFLDALLLGNRRIGFIDDIAAFDSFISNRKYRRQLIITDQALTPYFSFESILTRLPAVSILFLHDSGAGKQGGSGVALFLIRLPQKSRIEQIVWILK